MPQLSEAQLAHFDDLLHRGQIIPSLPYRRGALGISLPECIEFLGHRCTELERVAPEKFQVDIGTYWDGLNS